MSSRSSPSVVAQKVLVNLLFIMSYAHAQSLWTKFVARVRRILQIRIWKHSAANTTLPVSHAQAPQFEPQPAQQPSILESTVLRTDTRMSSSEQGTQSDRRGDNQNGGMKTQLLDDYYINQDKLKAKLRELFPGEKQLSLRVIQCPDPKTISTLGWYANI
jgi:hypothetical protein